MAATLSQIDNNSAKKKYRKKNKAGEKCKWWSRKFSHVQQAKETAQKQNFRNFKRQKPQKTATASFARKKTKKKDSKLHNEIDARNVQYTSTAGRCNRCKKQKKTQEKAKTWQTLEAESSRLSSTCVDFRWISVDSQTNKSNPKLNSFASLDIRVLYMLWPKMYAERHTTQPPYVVTKFGYKFTAAAQTTRKTSLSNAACHFYLQIFVVLRFWL